LVPTNATVSVGNSLVLTWPKSPSPTSVMVTYTSLGDRALYITSPYVHPGDSATQFKIDLVTTTPLDTASVPWFTETTRYLAPTLPSAPSTPAVQDDGQLYVALLANAFTPNSGQPGDTSTKVSVYYTNEPNDYSNGRLIQTLDYSSFSTANANDPFN